MTRRKSSALSLVALATYLSTGAARAEESDDAPPGRRHLVTKAGTAFQAGGGIARFIDSDPRSTGGNAGYWELRAAFGTRRSLGSEIAYVGSARSVPQMASPGMVSHGLEAALRINSVIETTGGFLLEPFSSMGVGWTRFGVGDGGTAGHHVLIVPIGFGLALGRDGFLMDLRLSYRPVLAGGELLSVAGGAAPLQSWALGSVAGFEF